MENHFLCLWHSGCDASPRPGLVVLFGADKSELR
jgi:hypothetical protein